MWKIGCIYVPLSTDSWGCLFSEGSVIQVPGWLLIFSFEVAWWWSYRPSEPASLLGTASTLHQHIHQSIGARYVYPPPVCLALATSTPGRIMYVLVLLGFLTEFIQSTSGFELSKIDELPLQHVIMELFGDGRQTITQPHPNLLCDSWGSRRLMRTNGGMVTLWS